MSLPDAASIPGLKAAVGGALRRLDESDVTDKLRVKQLPGTPR
jgi:hypothetical protein